MQPQLGMPGQDLNFLTIVKFPAIPQLKQTNNLSYHVKVSFFGQCSKVQLIPLQKFIIKTCLIQFLWFFRLKCCFKGQIISRIHLSLPNAYKLMCFDRNINGNRDVKFLFHCTEGRISL